jgi:Flp pilus assembly protein TadG
MTQRVISSAGRYKEAKAMMLSLFRRVMANGQGVAAVEFALAAPILVLALISLGDLGLAGAERMRLIDAARAGAQYATAHPTDSAGTTKAVNNATSGLGGTNLSVTLTQSCGCSDGSTITCGSGCASGPEWSYVTVAVSETYPLLINLPLPGVTNGALQLTANATLRSG